MKIVFPTTLSLGKKNYLVPYSKFNNSLKFPNMFIKGSLTERKSFLPSHKNITL